MGSRSEAMFRSICFEWRTQRPDLPLDWSLLPEESLAGALAIDGQLPMYFQASLTRSTNNMCIFGEKVSGDHSLSPCAPG